MSQNFCNQCGSPVEKGARYCTRCGALLSEDEPDGLLVPVDDVYSPMAQAPIERTTSMPVAAPSAGAAAPMDPRESRGMQGGNVSGSKAPKVVAIIACVVAVVAIGVLAAVVLGGNGGSGQTTAATTDTSASATTSNTVTTTTDTATTTETSSGAIGDIYNGDDYVLPDSATCDYTSSDLEGLSDVELVIAHNEIYARHGKKFRSENLQSYFDGKGWYSGKYSADEFDSMGVELNSHEQRNADVLQKLREQRGITDTKVIDEASGL